MPAELSRAVGMHAISDLHSSLPLRLLNKGPEYLRRQLEASKPGRKSAVERLAADKAKYVKSQQVISTRQDPVIALSSASESGSETCSVESRAASWGTAASTKPLELGKAVNSGGAPLELGKAVNSGGAPLELGKAVNSGRAPLELGKAVSSGRAPLELGKAVNSGGAPLELGKAVNSGRAPLELGKAVNSGRAPLELGKAVNSGRAPLELGKAVSSGRAPLELGKAVSSGRAPLQHGPPIARRSTRRQMRPDSLVIYRQKCELGRGQSQDSSRGSLVRRIFHGSIKEKQLASPELPRVMEDIAATESNEPLTAEDGDHEPGDHGAVQTIPVSTEGAGVCTEQHERPSKLSTPSQEVKEVKRRGLHRSQSDISSRYSKSFADSDTFFKYCGLEQEVIEDLGRENFSVVSDNVSFKIRSISMAVSESEFTRHSGDEGLLEDELTEQVPSSTSVIERNARIIKWLYTCKKAKETSKVIQELA